MTGPLSQTAPPHFSPHSPCQAPQQATWQPQAAGVGIALQSGKQSGWKSTRGTINASGEGGQCASALPAYQIFPSSYHVAAGPANPQISIVQKKSCPVAEPEAV